jgi:hypothetical protein
MGRSFSTLHQLLGTPIVRQHTLMETGVSGSVDDPFPDPDEFLGRDEVLISDCFGRWDAVSQLVDSYWVIHGSSDRDLRGVLEALHHFRDLLHCMALTTAPSLGTASDAANYSIINVCAKHAGVLEVDQA